MSKKVETSNYQEKVLINILSLRVAMKYDIEKFPDDPQWQIPREIIEEKRSEINDDIIKIYYKDIYESFLIIKTVKMNDMIVDDKITYKNPIKIVDVYKDGYDYFNLDLLTNDSLVRDIPNYKRITEENERVLTSVKNEYGKKILPRVENLNSIFYKISNCENFKNKFLIYSSPCIDELSWENNYIIFKD